MSHHGREGEHECPSPGPFWAWSALTLINEIAACKHKYTADVCDTWLEKNGLDCENSRRKARERKIKEIDAQIAALKSAKEKL